MRDRRDFAHAGEDSRRDGVDSGCSGLTERPAVVAFFAPSDHLYPREGPCMGGAEIRWTFSQAVNRDCGQSFRWKYTMRCAANQGMWVHETLSQCAPCAVRLPRVELGHLARAADLREECPVIPMAKWVASSQGPKHERPSRTCAQALHSVSGDSIGA